MNPQDAALPVGQTIELPPRKQRVSAEWVRKYYGCCPDCSPDEAARGYSSDEWLVDEWNAVELANRLDLSDDDLELICERLRERNRQIWGRHSIFATDSRVP